MDTTKDCIEKVFHESIEEGGDLGNRKKKRLRKDFDSMEQTGICYLSRVPPHMDPASLRQILSKYGDLQRIYLIPHGSTSQPKRKQGKGFQRKNFSEGWVEFTDKSIAKKVVRMLNGEQIGGRRRSSFYYDLWNIKYLSKFKWTDLTDEIANRNRTYEQKLAMEMSAAKRERDFYMSKVDLSRALKSIKKRQKSGAKALESKTMMRQIPQNKPFLKDSDKGKPHLSTNLLAGVFTGGT